MTEYSTCPDSEELAAWIDGDLDDITQQRLTAHVGGCERCSEVVDGVLAFGDEEALAQDGAGAGFELEDAEVAPKAEFQDSAPGISSSVRWRPYLAVALAACAVVWAVRLGPLAPAGELDFSTLDEPREAHRGAALEGQRARLCRLYFEGPASSAARTRNCLEDAASDSELALVAARQERFTQWLSEPSLHEVSCRILFRAWNRGLTGSRQEELRGAYDECLAEP